MTAQLLIPRTGGLNLIDAPDEIGAVGCVDALNVDFDKPGRTRSRDGYVTFSTETSGQQGAAAPFYSDLATSQLIIWDNSGDLRALNGAGTSIATHTTPTAAGVSFARIGTPTADRLYIAPGGGSDDMVRWDGTNFTTLTTPDARPKFVTTQLPDNRLVAAYQLSTSGSFTAAGSVVYFSDADAPETFDVTNSVDLRSGDGEVITGACQWGEMTFVFKQSWFAVFGGNSVGPDGGAEFNWRPVDMGSNTYPSLLSFPTPSKDGVYFATSRGIYLTAGGPPILVSRAIDPLFEGSLPATFQGDALSVVTSMVAINDKLFVAYRTTGNEYRLLKFNSTSGNWSYWQQADEAQYITSLRDPSGGNGLEQLVTVDKVSGGDVQRFSLDADDDAGTTITSRYRSGLYGFTGREQRVQRTRLWGTGVVTWKTSRNWDALSTGRSVTLGTSPDVDDGLAPNLSRAAHLMSHELSGTSPWTLHAIVHEVEAPRPPQSRTP